MLGLGTAGIPLFAPAVFSVSFLCLGREGEAICSFRDMFQRYHFI